MVFSWRLTGEGIFYNRLLFINNMLLFSGKFCVGGEGCDEGGQSCDRGIPLVLLLGETYVVRCGQELKQKNFDIFKKTGLIILIFGTEEYFWIVCQHQE